MVGIDAEVSEEHRLAAGMAAAAMRLDGDKHSVDAGEASRVVVLDHPALFGCAVGIENAQVDGVRLVRSPPAPRLEGTSRPAAPAAGRGRKRRRSAICLWCRRPARRAFAYPPSWPHRRPPRCRGCAIPSVRGCPDRDRGFAALAPAPDPSAQCRPSAQVIRTVCHDQGPVEAITPRRTPPKGRPAWILGSC